MGFAVMTYHIVRLKVPVYDVLDYNREHRNVFVFFKPNFSGGDGIVIISIVDTIPHVFGLFEQLCDVISKGELRVGPRGRVLHTNGFLGQRGYPMLTPYPPVKQAVCCAADILEDFILQRNEILDDIQSEEEGDSGSQLPLCPITPTNLLGSTESRGERSNFVSI